MKKKKDINKELFFDLYEVQGFSLSSIARELGISWERAKNIARDLGIYYKKEPLRDEYGRFIKPNQILPINRGENHPNYINGKSFYRRTASEHHQQVCFHCGSIHNLQVHHMDRNKNNNHFSNLRIVCQTCHIKIEHADKLLRRDEKGRFI